MGQLKLVTPFLLKSKDKGIFDSRELISLLNLMLYFLDNHHSFDHRCLKLHNELEIENKNKMSIKESIELHF